MGGNMNKIQYVANACRWFDRVNGNTYHSVSITRTEDGAQVLVPWQYGYGDSYRQTALLAMAEEKWIPKKYTVRGKQGTYKKLWYWERENNYPIQWNVSDGLKRDMVRNGER
jgi:hypothetical protein